MIVRAAEHEDYSEICDLVDRAFKQSKLENTIIKVTTCKDPSFQKGDLRVVEDGGKIVSIMMLIRRPLRIGTAIVNGAMVTPVATHPDYQRRGYCSAVMRDAIKYMENQGFDITILWGIPWFYTHYGYSPAMVKTELVMKTTQAGSTENLLCEHRSFAEADLEKMTCIYHSNTATRTCAEIRSPTMWEWKPGGPNVNLEVFTDKKGEVIGYCALGKDWGRPCTHEVGVLHDKACEIIFNSLLETAKQKGLREFYSIIHPDHQFARFVFWHDGEIRINRGGGAGMARVLNLVSLLTKMQKEFEHRLCYSEFHEVECTLKISSEVGFVVLNINHGGVSINTDNVECGYHLDIPLKCLNPLITGYKGIRELVNEPCIKLRGGKQALRLIEVLFPTGFPFGGCPPLVWE